MVVLYMLYLLVATTFCAAVYETAVIYRVGIRTTDSHALSSPPIPVGIPEFFTQLRIGLVSILCGLVSFLVNTFLVSATAGRCPVLVNGTTLVLFGILNCFSIVILTILSVFNTNDTK